MSGRSVGRICRSSAWVLAGACLALSTAAVAGTGRLVSPWVNQAPRIDGKLTPGEWNAATLIDLGAGVTLLLENDALTLYLALLDTGDSTFTSNDSVTLLSDDEGGAPPIQDDGAFGGALCHSTPNLGEGRIDHTFSHEVLYQEIPQSGFFLDQVITGAASFRSALQPEGLTYEAAIPLDGPAPLRASPGERFGIALLIFRGGSPVACLPACATLSDPSDYRNSDPRLGRLQHRPAGVRLWRPTRRTAARLDEREHRRRRPRSVNFSQ